MSDALTIEEADARVTWMRRRGVTKCWGIELGPEPSATDEQPSEQTAEEAWKARRNEMRRVAFLATGGPVPAVGRTK